MTINKEVLQQVTRLLPPNATQLEKAIGYAIAMQFARRPKNVKRSLWNYKTCPVHLLPWLAWTVGVEEWRNDWPEQIKRAQIRDAIVVAKKRGTLWAMERALNNYGVSIAVKCWYEYVPPKEPYTFDVTVVIDTDTESGVNNADMLASVKRDIDRNKSLRDHYTLTQGVKLRGGLQLLGLIRGYSTSRLKMQTDVQALKILGSLLMVGALRSFSSARLKFIIEEN